MVFFINDNRNYVLATNFKVMSSTLGAQTCIRRIPAKKLASRLLYARAVGRVIPKYLIVRNPYERLVSFYCDKFLSEPLLEGKRDLQVCQTKFLPYMNIQEGSDFATILTAFTRTSFEQFIDMIAKVISQDDHLLPQSAFFLDSARPIKHMIRQIVFPFNDFRILKMEHDRDVLSEDLGIDIRVVRNNTKRKSYQSYFSAPLYEKVNRLYEDDFILFGYDMEHDCASI